MTDAIGVGSFPAEIIQRATPDEIVKVAKQRVPDASIFDEFEPFTWSAQISSTRLDAYATTMAISSLKNYANDINTGVAFQDSHKTDSLARTLGYSVSGRFVGANGNGVAHVDADFYTLLGIDTLTDTFVRKLRGGLTRDVSIGFHGGQYICSICGRDMATDWSCFHYPGLYTYPEDKEGNQDRTADKVLVTARIENAHLSEVSGVYDGATPGAVILKAERDAKEGRIKPEVIRQIEQRYRIALPDKRVTVPAVTIHTEDPEKIAAAMRSRAATTNNAISNEGGDVTEGADMSGAETETRAHDIEQVRSVLTAAGFTHDDLSENVRAMVARIGEQDAELTRLRAIETEANATLRPMAAIGERYRTERIDRAVAEGKRAFGVEFNETAERAMLESFDIDAINRNGDAYQRVGDKLFPGGRVTVDHDERANTTTKTDDDQVPDATYRAR